MVKKYIKGNLKHSQAILDTLQSLGGINYYKIESCGHDMLYYIDHMNENVITDTHSGSLLGQFLQKYYEEIPLKDLKFNVKKEEFIQSLKPFDKFIGRESRSYIWGAHLFSHLDKDKVVDIASYDFPEVIPFNEDTIKYLGTIEELPIDFWDTLK